MADTLYLYIEPPIVQVLRGSYGKAGLKISSKDTFEYSELDNFLAREKSSNISIVASFSSLRHYNILLPVTKSRYHKPLIEGQLRDHFHESGDFSFSFSFMGETRLEGKSWYEFSVFAVDSSELITLIEPFTRFSKKITALTIPALALSALAIASGTSDGSIMCVADLGTTKNIFVIHNGCLCFTRPVPSSGFGIHEEDAQNIAMTMSYCSQNINHVPSRIFLMGPRTDTDAPSFELHMPITWMDLPKSLPYSIEEIFDVLVPAASSLPHAPGVYPDIIPTAYSTAIKRINVLNILSAVLGFVFVAAIINIFLFTIPETNRLKTRLLKLRTEITKNSRLMPEYDATKKEMDELSPYTTYLNARYAVPDFQRALILFSGFSKPELKRIVIDDVSFNTDPASPPSVKTSVKASISAPTYSELNASYSIFTNYLKTLSGVEIQNTAVNISDGAVTTTFLVRTPQEKK